MQQHSNPGFSYPNQKQPTQFAVVVALHVLAVWALVVATERGAIAKLITPTYVMLMNEDTPKPPPPTPKPKVKPETAPKPDIEIPRVASNAVEVVLSHEPAPPPAPIVATPAVSPATPSPTVEAALICPTQVRPEIPRQALLKNIQGLIKAEAVVSEGAVKDVHILSGPRIFHDAVRSAMMQYKCAVKRDPVLAVQEFNFHFD
jgi:protein TonB